MRLEKIVAQAFRGYPTRAEVLLSGDVVLLSGENGTGKTSLTEAFEWALFGTIVRKERSKTRGEYKGSSWIRSVHADENDETFVEVTLSDDDQEHVVRRRLVGSSVELTIDGELADDVRVLNLQTEDAFRPFLGQCEIQALIDSEQQSRWEQLSAILGFGSFGQLRERLQRLRTDTDRDPGVKRLRERVTRAVSPLTEPGQDPVAQAPDSLRAGVSESLGMADPGSWEAIRARAQSELDDLLVQDRRPPGLDVLIIGSKEVTGAAGRAAEVLRELNVRASEHRAWQEANQKGSFALQGLELIDPAHPRDCPFCAHTTLDGARIDVLRSEADHTQGPVPSDPRPGLLDEIRALLGAGPLNHEAAELLKESLADGPAFDGLQAAGAEQSALDDARQRAQRLADAVNAAYENASRFRGEPSALEGLVAELTSAVAEVGQRHAALRTQLDAVKTRADQSLLGSRRCREGTNVRAAEGRPARRERPGDRCGVEASKAPESAQSDRV